MKSVCQVLQEHANEEDLLSNMTRIARKVAFDFQSYNPGDLAMHDKKQIPYITSMLTKKVYFQKKVMRILGVFSMGFHPGWIQISALC